MTLDSAFFLWWDLALLWWAIPHRLKTWSPWKLGCSHCWQIQASTGGFTNPSEPEGYNPQLLCALQLWPGAHSRLWWGVGFRIDPPLDFGPCSRVSAFLVSLLCSSPCSLYPCPTDSGSSKWPTVEFCLESSEGHSCLFKPNPLDHGWKLSPGRLLGNLRRHCRRSLCLMDCILALLGAHC